MGNQRNLNYVHFHCGVVNPKVIKANQSTDSYMHLRISQRELKVKTRKLPKEWENASEQGFYIFYLLVFILNLVD